MRNSKKSSVKLRNIVLWFIDENSDTGLSIELKIDLPTGIAHKSAAKASMTEVSLKQVGASA